MTYQETSRQAAASIKPHLSRLQVDILNLVIARNGVTCDEVERSLELRHQTASARIRELASSGLIQDSGTKRKTSSGRTAVVWRHVRRSEQTQTSLFEVPA